MALGRTPTKNWRSGRRPSQGLQFGRPRQAGHLENGLFPERLAHQQRIHERVELPAVLGQQPLRFRMLVRLLWPIRINCCALTVITATETPCCRWRFTRAYPYIPYVATEPNL